MPTRAEVLAVARLARLSFSADELDRMAGDLEGILAHMHALRQVDVGHRADSGPADAVGNAAHAAADGAADDPQPPDASLAPQDTPSCADVIGADPLSMPPSYLAPDWRDGFFTVPRLPTHGGRRE